MEYSNLGTSDIKVSKICLGTMTYGEQNTEKQAFEQMDYALNSGVNFFDTAEMYAVPPKAETQGKTEEIIGNWLEKNGNREKVILATKVVGRSENFPYIRESSDQPRLDRKNIEYALHGSLKRLKTDYIDLYQLHWPDRKTNYFGQLGYIHDEEDKFIDLQESLEALNEFVKQGKIREIGLSNETPWGVLDALRACDKYNLPKVQSVQNPYNLLNRTYEVGMAEISIREKCGLLAYSPLAFGVLSGKYLNGARPKDGRITLYQRFQRYNNAKCEEATAKYVKLAKENNITPSQMALSYVNCRPFVTSNIIGATKIEQLKENIDSINVKLSDEVIEEIEKIHSDIPNPAP